VNDLDITQQMSPGGMGLPLDLVALMRPVSEWSSSDGRSKDLSLGLASTPSLDSSANLQRENH
jgi:hypothetical protein